MSVYKLKRRKKDSLGRTLKDRNMEALMNFWKLQTPGLCLPKHTSLLESLTWQQACAYQVCKWTCIFSECIHLNGQLLHHNNTSNPTLCLLTAGLHILFGCGYEIKRWLDWIPHVKITWPHCGAFSCQKKKKFKPISFYCYFLQNKCALAGDEVQAKFLSFMNVIIKMEQHFLCP